MAKKYCIVMYHISDLGALSLRALCQDPAQKTVEVILGKFWSWKHVVV